MTTPFFIRSATERDIPAIAGLLDVLNQHEGYAAKTEPAQLQQALFAQAREVQLAALVAQVGEVVVGVLLFYPGYDTLSACVGYHLADMVVDTVHRRQGIGRALIATLAENAQAEQKEWISLTALSANASARAFYLSLGMQQMDVHFFAMGKRAMSQL